MELVIWLGVLSLVAGGSALAAWSLVRRRPVIEGEHVSASGWVADVGPVRALELVERELRDIASRTPLPGAAGVSVSIEGRYRACRRQMLAISVALRGGDERARAVASLIESAPPGGMQVSPTNRAYESRQIVAEALTRLRAAAA